MDSRLLQLADSAFPAGSLAHSAGFEALRQLGLLKGEDALVLRLGPAGRRACGWLACAGALAIFVAAIYAGWSHTANVASSATPMLGYSVGWIFVSMPIGFALTLFHAAMILADEGPDAGFRNATESVIDSAEA